MVGGSSACLLLRLLVRVMSALLFRGIPYGSEFKDKRSQAEPSRGRIRGSGEEKTPPSPSRCSEATSKLTQPRARMVAVVESGRGISPPMLPGGEGGEERARESRNPCALAEPPFINKALPLYDIFRLFTTVTSETVGIVSLSFSILSPSLVNFSLLFDSIEKVRSFLPEKNYSMKFPSIRIVSRISNLCSIIFSSIASVSITNSYDRRYIESVEIFEWNETSLEREK